jgi:hypothetical protein
MRYHHLLLFSFHLGITCFIVISLLLESDFDGAFLLGGTTFAGGSFLVTIFVVSFLVRLVGVDCEITFFAVVLALALVALLGAFFSNSFVF